MSTLAHARHSGPELSGPLRVHVEALFDLIDRCDFDRLGEILAPDCRYDRPGYPTLEGLNAIEAFYRHDRVIETGRHRITRFVETRDAAVALGSFTGRLRSGDSAAIEFADTYRFSPAGIIERKTYFFTPAL